MRLSVRWFGVPLLFMAGASALAADDTHRSLSQDDVSRLSYTSWRKYCEKGRGSDATGQLCYIGADGRIEGGQQAIEAMLIEPGGDAKKVFRVTVPLGMQLPYGTRVIVDDNPPALSQYVICFSDGCLSDYQATPRLIANLREGQKLTVEVVNSEGQSLTLRLPLADFAKAYDGLGIEQGPILPSPRIPESEPRQPPQ
jgi:invasion protein IalB